MEHIVGWLLSLLSGLNGFSFGKELAVFIISLMPILELRGGLLAASLLGVRPLRAYIISIIGNLIPVPFILLFISNNIGSISSTKAQKQ